MTSLTTVRCDLWTAVSDILFYHGAPWELDDALSAEGIARPPCLAMDQVGLDLVAENVTTPTARNILSRMVSEGRLGQKVGWGFYRYTQTGGALADPLIDDLIREEAHFAAATRDELDETALVEKVKAVCREIEARGSEGSTGRCAILIEQLGCDGPDWWRH